MGYMTQPLCVVVGAGGGLGKSLAATFAGAGHDVALVSRSKGNCSTALEAATTANPGSNVRYFQADATQPLVLERTLGAIAAEMGPIEVLIYNVRGEPKWKPPLDMTYDELRDVLAREAAA